MISTTEASHGLLPALYDSVGSLDNLHHAFGNRMSVRGKEFIDEHFKIRLIYKAQF
jgi:hypothetical protein